MEFQPANKAYRSTALLGFRTFLKVNGTPWEPFAPSTGLPSAMRIAPHEFRINERHPRLGLAVEVAYFTVPQEGFPSLVRSVRITNTSRRRVALEMLDGLPALLPCGLDNGVMKTMSNLIEAWCGVERLERGVEFYKTRTALGDSTEVGTFRRGHFYAATLTHRGRISRPITLVCPKTVFGPVTGFQTPQAYWAAARFTPPAREPREGFIPCAFAHAALRLAPGETVEISSVIGRAESPAAVRTIARRARRRGQVAQWREANRALVADLTGRTATASASPAFDLYTRQNFLDNVMRGGLAIDVAGRPFYVYFRAHGDTEREYNDFKTVPSFLAEGNGNYRDICQNRRCDNYFHPGIGAMNILRFMDLIQLDGFNPLVVRARYLRLKGHAAARALLARHLRRPSAAVAALLAKPFVVGAVLTRIQDEGLAYRTTREALAGALLEAGLPVEESVHGQGYWTDHWFYNLDLLESFEGIQPEAVRDLLLRPGACTWYDNAHVVAPRRDKVVEKAGRLWQADAVREDPEKRAGIAARPVDPRLVRTRFGRGGVYRSSLAAKLLCLVATKGASLDAAGIGLEMESEKPDWCDALNGLPGRFGSSLSETLELKRLCGWLLAHLVPGDRVMLAVEIRDCLLGVARESRRVARTRDTHECWERTTTLKEAYRARTRLGVSGREVAVDGATALAAVRAVLARCDLGVARCLKRYGTYVTYFMNEPTRWTGKAGDIRIRAFRQVSLPLYLEGFVHALRTEGDARIPAMVRSSGLYDRKLGMYRVNAPLGKTSHEIGRAKTFPRGWLENESIWTHMEYKYLLELLRAGRYADLSRDLKTALVPFLDPAVYRRSILENCSFIVGSGYPDPDRHGRGFVARLTGASAEFIDLWVRMTSGKNPFTLDAAGRLRFGLTPALPGWLFKDGAFTFRFLGAMDVTLLNPSGRDAWHLAPRSYRLITPDGRETILPGPFLPEPWAGQVRDRQVTALEVDLA